MWSDWSVCLETCGIGLMIRRCLCVNLILQYNGRNCIGVYLEIKECMIKFCFVDGGWSLWVIWIFCLGLCGGG